MGGVTPQRLDELEAALEAFDAGPSVSRFETAGIVADAIALSIRAAARADPDVEARHHVVERFTDAAQRVTVAAHEAGHVIVGWATGDRAVHVTVAPGPEHRELLGYADFLKWKPTQHAYLDRAAMSLGGATAERLLWRRIPGAYGARLFGLPNLGGRGFPPDDLAHAEAYCARLDRAVAHAEQLLDASWADLLRVSDALLAEKTLGVEQLDALLSATTEP